MLTISIGVDIGTVYVWSSQAALNAQPSPLFASASPRHRDQAPARLNNFGSEVVEEITGIGKYAATKAVFIRTSAGSVYSIGDGLQGSLGNQVAAASTITTPTKINLGVGRAPAVSVGAGDAATAVVLDDGSVLGFGTNSMYQFCDTTQNILVPRVLPMTNVRQVFAADSYNAYVYGNGSIYFCGSNFNGGFPNAGAGSGRYSVPIAASLLGVQYVDIKMMQGVGVGLTGTNDPGGHPLFHGRDCPLILFVSSGQAHRYLGFQYIW